MVNVPKSQKVHLTGICGRAMGALALELANTGWLVSGSDQNPFPPMAGLLAESKVRSLSSFDANNIPDDVDCVIAGSCFGADNPEISSALERGIPIESFPKFIQKNLLMAEQRLVVTGTNGKSTTTAMLTKILDSNGLDPDFLIGATVPQLKQSARFRGSEYLAIEGDEYPGGHWDPEPKFASYSPTIGILTNVHHDHPEVFKDTQHTQVVFEKFVDLIPGDGLLVANSEDKNSLPLLSRTRCSVETVGFSDSSTCRISDCRFEPGGSQFTFLGEKARLKIHGEMNVRNAAMAIRAAVGIGLSPRTATQALADFCGIPGRQETLYDTRRFTHIYDIAYHPHALTNLLACIRERYPQRRIVLALEPQNTGGKGGYFQRSIPSALRLVDQVLLTRPANFGGDGIDPFDLPQVAHGVSHLRTGVKRAESTSELPHLFAKLALEGDVLVSCLSSPAGPILDKLTRVGSGL